MLIEIWTFKLREGADASAFVEADARVQTEFYYLQPGLLRRITARAADDRWLVLNHWYEETPEVMGGPAVTAFLSLVDRNTLRIERFVSLD